MANYDQLPEKVIAALRDADKARVLVPIDLDAAILNKAKANIVRRRRRIVPWLAAAAALIIGALVMLQPTAKAREDVNRDGRVDIRDALLLARKVSAGQTVKDWDFNEDGRVDQLDAAAIAARAVKLAKGGPS